MKRLLLAALGAALVAVPSQAAAQAPYFYDGIPHEQEYLRFLSGSGVSGGYGVQVGPYLGRFDSDPTSASFSIYCVDYNHYAQSGWVNTTQLGSSVDLSDTRLNDYSRYRQAAYLSTLFDPGHVPQSEWGELHAAIWTLTSGVTPGGSTGSFLTAAYSAPDDFSTSGWYVLTPTNPDYSGSGQEFLMRSTSVPEPSTLLLLGTGALLFVLARRRRVGPLGDIV